jgi:hypothetical protein
MNIKKGYIREYKILGFIKLNLKKKINLKPLNNLEVVARP